MVAEVEHPDIRYVVYPVHLDGTLTGQQPRRRHDPDCGHFDWGDGTILGTPEQASEEQMLTIPACKSCITRRGTSSASPRQGASSERTGSVCPTCYQVTPMTGICDTCG